MRFIRSNVWLLFLAGFLAIFPLIFPLLSFVNIVSEMLIMGLFAVSLNLLIGYTGIISFGHAAFFAVGSYTVGIMLQKLSGSLPLAIPSVLLCAMIFSGIAALVIGYFCTRLTAIYFSFLTLAFSQIVYAIIIKWASFTGGDQGLIGGIPKPPIPFFGVSIDMTSPFSLYYLCVVSTILSFFLLRVIIDSPFGWILRSIRDNPERINFLGINVKRYQIIVFIISGIFTGLAGGLMALHLSGSYPDHAHWAKNAEPIFMIMVGGLKIFAGPILGSIIVTQLSAYLSSYIEMRGLIFGGILVLLLMISREGILDVLTAKWGALKRIFS
jgi:branched-chain amino acid transport system permease protein